MATALNSLNVLAADCPCNRSGYTCQCNDSGKVTEEIKNDGTWKCSTTYDENGNTTSQTYYAGAANVTTQTATSQYRYAYDTNGNQISTTYYSGVANITGNKPDYQYRYTYDIHNKKTSDALYNGEANIINNVRSQQRHFIYDENNNQIDFTAYYGEDIATHAGEVDCSGGGYVSGCTGARQSAMDFDYTTSNSSPIICATGYLAGCTGATITLADGSSAIMKSGQIVSKTFPDGSTTLYDEDGSIKGFKNKRIYTIDEANAVAGDKHRISIKYR